MTNRIPVKIKCPKHGIWEQIPFSHMNKSGCEKCLYENLRIVNKEKFINKANFIFDFKYDYSEVNYLNNDAKVIIICPDHGRFLKEPGSHLKLQNPQGCPSCSESIGELKVENFLKKFNILFERQKTFDGCKSIYPLRFDFYLPDLNLCIEFNGMQHYKPIEYFGGEKTFLNIKKRDRIKYKFCKENNIKLLKISYLENIEEKLSSINKLVIL